MSHKDWIVRYLMLCVALFSGFGWADDGRSPTAYVDVHTHLLPGELPKGLGGPRGTERDQGSQMPNRPPPPRRPLHQHRRTADRGGDYEAAAKNFVAVLDRLGVKHAIVMPPPHTENQRGASTYEVILPALRRHPKRLLLGAGGGSLNPLVHATDPDKVTEEIRTQFDRIARQIIADGAKCFGEMAALHISYSNAHVFEQAPPDHPLFMQLADLSARHGIPIDLHMDCIPQDMATPQLWIRRSPRNPKQLKANIPGLERLLSHNHKAKIVWQHVGRDTMNQLTPDLLRRLLSKHPNLFCAIWVRSREMPAAAGPPGKNQILDEDYKIKDEWLRLFKNYPDRFMIGSDGFFTSSTENLDTSVASTWKFLEMLPEDLRQTIGAENAARVYNL